MFTRTTLLSIGTMITPLAVVPHAGTAQTNTSTEPPRSSISLEMDPAPFLLKGYSFSLRYAPKRMSHWSVMASLFSSDFPDGMMTSENKEAGWQDAHFEPSQALFVDYSITANGKGLFIGPSVFLYHKSAVHGPTGTAYSFTTLYPNLRIGWTWFPFKRAGFYVSPWVNTGHEFLVSGEQPEEAPAYALPDLSYIAAVHVGYRHWF